MKELLSKWMNLPAAYRPIPFWSWNDELDSDRLRGQIRWMHENGIGGFFMHARGGLKTPYLGEEWMQCIEACCDEAKKLGMDAWAYDENGWPSGFAGGLLLEDTAVLQAMEPGEQPSRMCYMIKKDGTYSGDLADRDQLKLLERYIFHILGHLVDDIASGNVAANPYSRGSSHNACAFCPYASICHPETLHDRRNYKAMTSQRFWEEIGKEMQRHG